MACFHPSIPLYSLSSPLSLFSFHTSIISPLFYFFIPPLSFLSLFSIHTSIICPLSPILSLSSPFIAPLSFLSLFSFHTSIICPLSLLLPPFISLLVTFSIITHHLQSSPALPLLIFPHIPPFSPSPSLPSPPPDYLLPHPLSLPCLFPLSLPF
jgi:hypothetical protein